MGGPWGYNADAAASGNGCFNSSNLWTTTETRQFDHYNDGGDHLVSSFVPFFLGGGKVSAPKPKLLFPVPAQRPPPWNLSFREIT